jgi:ribosomal protein S10
MSFVTRLTLQSGDRAALDSVVEDIRERVSRKGAEMKGPHSAPPERLRVPQYKQPTDDTAAQFDAWDYTVYKREIEIVGHDELAHTIAAGSAFPDSVHVAAEVEQIRSQGS